jgi:SAM domain (Sterile alpha motif)
MYYNYAYQVPSYQMQQMQLPPSQSLPSLSPIQPPSSFPYTGYHHNSSQYNTHQASSSLPSIETFLRDLDRIHGEGSYTKYSEEFVKEKVTINIIPTLDNHDLISLGVNTIGERKILVQTAKYYVG